MTIKAKDRIGTVINDWKILEVTRIDKSKTTLYKAVSTITGRVIKDVRIHDIERNKYAANIKPEQKYTWFSQRLHSIFKNMKSRCYNHNYINYNNYGGRGIMICQEWLDNPKAFEEWALENGYQNDLTIDRIDVNDNYSPFNCRWIPLCENAKWKRSTNYIWVGNYVDSLRGWSLKVHKSESWFGCIKRRYGYDYAYNRLLEEIEKLGGIKKVIRSNQENDISKFLEDIENDCLEADL